MNDEELFDDVPAWGPGAGVAALLASSVAALVASLLAAVATAVAGAGSPTPASVVVLSALSAAGTVTAVVLAAGLTEPVRPTQFGLRPVSPAAILAGLAAAAGLAVLVALWGLVVDLSAALPVPGELDTRSTLARTYDLTQLDGVRFGPGLLASALARCVLPAVAGELLLRGFAFPALTRWRGPWVAGLVVAVLFGGLFDLASDAALAVPSIVLGGVLCVLYVVTGSLLPGIALSAGAAGIAFGVSCGLSAGGVVAVALGCAVVALALVAPLARPRRDAGTRRSSLLARRRWIA